jgi:catalase (peroxidase I)
MTGAPSCVLALADAPANIRRTSRRDEAGFNETRCDLKSQFRKGPSAWPQVREAPGKFVHDFVAAWTKVMNADRFDI